MIRFLLLALVYFVPTAILDAQTALPTSRKTCDPRTDLNKLPGSGSSLHHVFLSGSYFLSENILCGVGQTAITIDPGASSVVIDFNGFAISGTAALSSVHGIQCPAAPARRAHLELQGPRMYLFGGDAISIDSVEDVAVSDGVIMQCGADGIDVQNCGSVRLAGNALHSVIDAVSAHSVTGIKLQNMASSSSARGWYIDDVEVVLIDQCSVQDCTGDGIVLTDASSPPGVPHRFVWSLSRTQVLGCGDDGIDVSSSSPWPVELRCRDLTVAECNADGLEFSAIGVSPTGLPWISSSNSSFVRNGGSGLHVSRPTADPLQVTLERVLCWGNNGDGVQVSGRAGLGIRCEGLWSSSNGQSGVRVGYLAGVSTTSAGDVSLVRVQCSDNGLDGCAIDAAALPTYGKVSMQDFHFTGNHRDGWNLLNVSGKGTHGTLKGNARDGLHADGSDIDFSSVGIADNGDDGVEISGSHYKGWDGLIYGHPKKGLNAVNLSHCQLTNIQISENGEDGVYLESSTFKGVDGTILECGFNGLYASSSQVEITGTSIGSNGQDGLHLERSRTWCFRVTVTDNAGDGVDSSTLPGDPATPLALTDCQITGNQGYGVDCRERADVGAIRSGIMNNAAGGLRSSAGGACVQAQCRVTQCTFDGNGGVACDLQNARGGAIEQCVVSASPIGIRVGDPSGAGCCAGVRVTDCTVSQCATGIAVDVGGGHLVVRNFASLCTVAPFAVGAGNLFGPVITTSADLALSSNPHANYAQ